MSQDQCRRRTPTRSGLRRATRVPRSASPWGQPSPRTPPTSPRSADRSWSGAGPAKHPRRDSRTLRTQLFRCRSRPRPEAGFLGHASSAPGSGAAGRRTQPGILRRRPAVLTRWACVGLGGDIVARSGQQPPGRSGIGSCNPEPKPTSASQRVSPTVTATARWVRGRGRTRSSPTRASSRATG